MRDQDLFESSAELMKQAEHARPEPGSHVCRCGSELVYNDEYDAYYCKDSKYWVESKCSDPECYFCPGRPKTAN